SLCARWLWCRAARAPRARSRLSAARSLLETTHHRLERRAARSRFRARQESAGCARAEWGHSVRTSETSFARVGPVMAQGLFCLTTGTHPPSTAVGVNRFASAAVNVRRDALATAPGPFVTNSTSPADAGPYQ